MLRQEACQRAHHHVGHAVRYLVVGIDDGRGEGGVHDRPLGRLDLDGAPAAGIGRNEIIWIDCGLEPAIDARGGDREWRVHRSRDHWVSAGEIHAQPVGGFFDAEANPEQRVVTECVIGDAVTIAEILETAVSIRQIGERGAHQPLRIIQDLGHVTDELGAAIALRKRAQTFACATCRGELCAKIAPALLRRANVRQNDLFEVGVHRAAADQAHRRQPKPFAENFRDGAVAARRCRAHVRPMGTQTGVAEQLARVEGRPHHIHVGQVAAAEIGIVVNENVAVVHVPGKGGDDSTNRVRHRAEMDRQIGPLRHHLAAGVEDAAGIVAGRLQQGRIGGLCQDNPHLLGDLVKAVFDDLERSGISRLRRIIHCCPAPCGRRVSSTKPCSSMIACHPGGTRMVDSSDSITTGPASVRPAGIRLRS